MDGNEATIGRCNEIMRRVSERYLVTSGDQWAARNDAFHRAEVDRLRKLVAATDAAMMAEGIGEGQRDRIIFRLLYGDPPEVFNAPDWREAANRAASRDLAMQQIILNNPLTPPGRL